VASSGGGSEADPSRIAAERSERRHSGGAQRPLNATPDRTADKGCSVEGMVDQNSEVGS
jgi:hypothetical protein